MNKLTEWFKSHKSHTTVISVIVVMTIVLSVAYANGVFAKEQSDSNTDDFSEVFTNTDTFSVTATAGENIKTVELDINVEADDKVNENSTPTIVHVWSIDEREEPVDIYHAVDSGEKTDTIEVPASGAYRATAVGVINSDGSVAKAVKVSTRDAEKATIDVKLNKTIPADKVTEEDIKEIENATKAAIEKGDSSLKGDAGKSILDAAEAIRYEIEEMEANMQEKMDKAKSNETMTQQEYSSWIAALTTKTFLTKSEVSDLYGLGLVHVQRLFDQPDADFVYYIGNRQVAEREKLEAYIRAGKATGI